MRANAHNLPIARPALGHDGGKAKKPLAIRAWAMLDPKVLSRFLISITGYGLPRNQTRYMPVPGDYA